MDEHIIRGRPDFLEPDFGVTHLAKVPRYVYATCRNAMLVHKVARVEAHWYEARYDHLLRLDNPKLVAKSVCGQIFFIHLPYDRKKFRASLCEVPATNAVLCGRCHGRVATFGKHNSWPCTKEIAKVRLGCIVRGRRRPPAK